MQTRTTTAIGALAMCVSAALATESSVPHLKADQVHALGFDGFGVTVAVIDTGIDYSHPGLAGHIHPDGASFEGGVLQGDAGVDVYGLGHGTYMSLIIADQLGMPPRPPGRPAGVRGPFSLVPCRLGPWVCS